MTELVRDLIPHAPQMGLYVAPEIPPDLLRNAVESVGGGTKPDAVLALFDNSIFGNARDGALLTGDGIIFRKSGQPVHMVRYEDITHVDKKKGFFSKALHLDVNRGRATFTVTIDVSNNAEALDYLHRFLQETMLQTTPVGTTDWDAVQQALMALRRRGLLTHEDYARLMRGFR